MNLATSDIDDIARKLEKRGLLSAGFAACLFPYRHDGRKHIMRFGNLVAFDAPTQANQLAGTTLKILTGSERVERLRSEIAQLEARYDGLFPPGVYSVLEALRGELVALNKPLGRTMSSQ